MVKSVTNRFGHGAGTIPTRSAVVANAGLRPYPELRDSGVWWLGDVPAHWEVERLKWSLANVVEQAAELPRVGAVLALEDVESWTGRVAVADSSVSFDSQLKGFQAGDVLFGKLRPYLAKVARLSNDGLCVGEFLVLRPRHMNVMGAYYEHLLRSKKQAIVHQAVTGQIDSRTGRPYQTYKPAGVEWLQEIPAHWETRAFARCAVETADYRGATPPKTETGVFLVTARKHSARLDRLRNVEGVRGRG